jgi:hypothetical protein
VEQLDAQQAREHLAMVDRILAESSQRLSFGAEYFIVWGCYGAFATLLWQLAALHRIPPTALLAQVVVLAGAIAFTVWRGRVQKQYAVRRSIVQREFFNVLWLTVGLACVVNVAGFNIFPGIAQAAIWSFAEAIVLFFIGMHGNRRATIAGIAVIVSMVAANFLPRAEAMYPLAAGMLLGYAGFGVAELLARD